MLGGYIGFILIRNGCNRLIHIYIYIPFYPALGDIYVI